MICLASGVSTRLVFVVGNRGSVVLVSRGGVVDWEYPCLLMTSQLPGGLVIVREPKFVVFEDKVHKQVL
jgi:hypothetical protein